MYKMKTFMKSKSRRNKYVLCNKVHPLLGKLKCRHPKCNLSLLQHVKDRYGKSSPIPLLLNEYGETYGINVTNNDYMFMESCETTSQNQFQPVLNGQSSKCVFVSQTHINIAVNLKRRKTNDKFKDLVLIKSMKNENLLDSTLQNKSSHDETVLNLHVEVDIGP